MTIVREYARKSQTSPCSRPRPILDSNLKISNNKIGNEKNKQTNKQTTTAAATENKQENKTKLVELENFFGEVRKRN